MASSEEGRIAVRAVDFHVAQRTVLVLHARLVVERWGVGRANRAGVAVALETELSYLAPLEQARVVRPVSVVTDGTALDLQRRVLEGERPLLVGMALHAGRVRAIGEPHLFRLEPAMRIVTIAADHRAFEHAMMERHREASLD